MKRAVVAAALAAGLAACGARQRSSRADDAIFYVKTNVADASLYVDGRYIGPIRVVRGGIAVEPGTHRLELRHDDYFSRYLLLELKRAERKQLELMLAPVLP